MTLSRIRSVLAGVGVIACSAGAALAAVAPVTEIPEPTSFALIAAAVGGVAWIKFRHKK